MFIRKEFVALKFSKRLIVLFGNPAAAVVALGDRVKVVTLANGRLAIGFR